MGHESCRPRPWDIAFDLHPWKGGRNDLGHVIRTNERSIAPSDRTSDGVNRMELTPRLAMQNRRIFGFVSEILESGEMINTDAMWRFQAVVQILYFDDIPESGNCSRFRGRTSAFSSNIALADSDGIMFGAIAKDIMAPSFGPHLADQLESWDMAAARRWNFPGLGGGGFR